jgi:hypothetical protein
VGPCPGRNPCEAIPADATGDEGLEAEGSCKAPAAHYGEQAEQLERGNHVVVQGGEVAEWV